MSDAEKKELDIHHIVDVIENKRVMRPDVKYDLMLLYGFVFIFFGFLLDPPNIILKGLVTIILSPSNLLTDYIELTSIGAAFVNSGLVTVFSVLVAKIEKAEISGSLFAAFFAMSGFAFFGKNLFNSLPIIVGVFVYTKLNKKPYSRYVLVSLFGSALAPAVSEIAFGLGLPTVLGLFLGVLTGFVIGLCLPPLASHCFQFHEGLNLYNIGFAAGIIGMILVSVIRAFGYTIETNSILSSGNNVTIAVFLYIAFVSLFFIGFFANGRNLKGYKELLKSSGKAPIDFANDYGDGVTIINMGLVGIFVLTYVLAIGGTLNGPVIGGIHVVVGFGAHGKHLKNMIPIILGVFLAAVFTGSSPASTNSLLSTLFGTALSPIAGYYGIFPGIIAGGLHFALVTNVGFLHGGLDLYNNGFSCGFIAAFMAPLLDSYYHIKGLWRKKA